MDWIKVSIFTTSEGIEPLSGRLYQLGITGLEIEDEKDFKDFLENNKQYWDYVDDELIKEKEGETEVIAYVSDNAAGHEMLMAIRNTVAEMKQLDDENEFGRLEIHIDNMKEEDWANNWKKYFHPLEVGKKILIKPEWEELKDNTDRIVFNINPGMSFGTGGHYTTQLCIETLEKYIKPGVKVLDLGCGSGILSEKTENELTDCLLGFRYWIDEPGNDAMWFWSENHALMFHTCQLLAGELFPDEVFTNSGLTGRQMQAKAKNMLYDWFVTFRKEGFTEDEVEGIYFRNAMRFFEENL